jgi:hypothetical protein
MFRETFRRICAACLPAPVALTFVRHSKQETSDDDVQNLANRKKDIDCSPFPGRIGRRGNDRRSGGAPNGREKANAIRSPVGVMGPRIAIEAGDRLATRRRIRLRASQPLEGEPKDARRVPKDSSSRLADYSGERKE